MRFSKTPSVMQKFDLEVNAPEDAAPHASFQMRGMNMGMNRYRLIWDGKSWHAEVMLPACIQGRHDWILRLEAVDKVYEIPFVSS